MMILNCVLLIIAVVFASIAIYNTIRTKRDCERLKKANELEENVKMMKKLIELNESRKFYDNLLKEREKKED